MRCRLFCHNWKRKGNRKKLFCGKKLTTGWLCILAENLEWWEDPEIEKFTIISYIVCEIIGNHPSCISSSSCVAPSHACSDAHIKCGSELDVDQTFLFVLSSLDKLFTGIVGKAIVGYKVPNVYKWAWQGQKIYETVQESQYKWRRNSHQAERRFRQSVQTWGFLARKNVWEVAMAILAASSNIAWVTRRESVGSKFCNDRRVVVREWPRAPISMVTNEVLWPLRSRSLRTIWYSFAR